MNMRKYPDGQAVGAVYDNAPADNPFLAAMPELLPQDEFMDRIRGSPPLPTLLSRMSLEERRQALPMLSTLFFPMGYMYAIYDHLYRAITMTYKTRTVVEEIRQTNALFSGREGQSYATQAATGSILGVPGIGKTSAIRRCLAVMPQVIEHMDYQGSRFSANRCCISMWSAPATARLKRWPLISWLPWTGR